MFENHPLFKNTNFDISKYIIIKDYNPNDVIFNEEAECNYLGIVIVGEIIISTITTTEKEEIINILSPNEVFGDLLVFSSTPTYLGNVIAKRKSTIALISKNNLQMMFKLSPVFLNNYLTHICNKALLIKTEAKLFAHKNIRDRILYYFNTLSKQQNTHSITIPSVSSIANILSLPRPSVSRELSKLVSEGYLIKQQNTITIL